MNGVDRWMTAFQKGYREKKLETRLDFIKETLLMDASTVFMGYDLDQWCSSPEDISNLLEKQWTMDFNFNFEDATVQDKGDFVFLYTTATMSHFANPLESLQESIQPLMNDLENPIVLDEVIRQITHTIDDYSKTSSPLRFTAILVKEGETYKAHQIQFSLDAVMLWQYRYMSPEALEVHFEMGKKTYDSEIKALLSKFQVGYDRRDLKGLDDFMTLFVKDPDMISIGTDAEEFLVGPDELREIIESDWTYWGDFQINIEGAQVVSYGEMAYFVTKAKLKKYHKEEAMIEGIKHYLTNEVLGAQDRDGMIHGMRSLLDLRTEMHKGEAYFAPMRFSGYCVRESGQWKFGHIQYSDYMKTPEKFNV